MRSLFLKIFLWFWVTVLLVGLAMVITWSLERDIVISHWQATTAEAMLSYAEEAAAIYEQGGLTAVNSYLQEQESRSGLHAVLVDASGTNVNGRTPRAPKELLERALQSGQPEFAVTNGGVFGAQRALGPSGQSYLLQVRMLVGPVGYRLSPAAQVLRWALAILISGIICYLLTRYLTRPILNLQAAARELAAGDLSARVGPAMGRRRDEIGELVHDFNRMAERIENLMTSQRLLISDISHELRSPLARLNVALGLARQRAGSQAAIPLSRIEREADRLNELIGRILSLARMEAASSPPERRAVDLATVVTEIVADAEFEAQERDCRVLWNPSLPSVQVAGGAIPAQTCCILGSAELLRSGIENVVRNAVRYTAPGTAIEITLTSQDSSATIRVRDHGAGVPDSELGNLFRPFYRVAGARERQTGGAGLGLAIAERAVHLHGGTIRAENSREIDGGLIVEIRLPLMTEPAESVSQRIWKEQPEVREVANRVL